MYIHPSMFLLCCCPFFFTFPEAERNAVARHFSHFLSSWTSAKEFVSIAESLPPLFSVTAGFGGTVHGNKQQLSIQVVTFVGQSVVHPGSENGKELMWCLWTWQPKKNRLALRVSMVFGP